MEMIAATGGIICTWPLKWVREDGSGRLTIDDWAEENYAMKERLGIEHIGLGTDGGGVLPEMVEGYKSILDLPKLVDAMGEVGFKRSEIAAYMGGNLFRVIKQCIG
jgi:microsomal dipeptidase-like Zn-dependent dipeptidase